MHCAAPKGCDSADDVIGLGLSRCANRRQARARSEDGPANTANSPTGLAVKSTAHFRAGECVSTGCTFLRSGADRIALRRFELFSVPKRKRSHLRTPSLRRTCRTSAEVDSRERSFFRQRHRSSFASSAAIPSRFFRRRKAACIAWGAARRRRRLQRGWLSREGNCDGSSGTFISALIIRARFP